jgi:hypothetical protein
MARNNPRRRAHAILLPAVVALLALVGASPAGARPATAPTVDVQHFAGLAPDGGSISVQVIASCPERWTVVEAVVRVSQPQASGQASFPLSCIGSLRVFSVLVPTSGSFELGEAVVSASVVITRGKTQSAEDSETLKVDPLVLVELAGQATLESGGGAVSTAVTVACPIGTVGLESRLVVSQAGQVSGVGTYTPECDGSRHTFPVMVTALQGIYQAGIAQALTFANVKLGEDIFYGVDDDGALEIVG